MSISSWRFLVLTIVVFLSPLIASDDIGATKQPLVNGGNDSNTSFRNSTVQVSGDANCTGVLIAPQVVITAGHCNIYGGELGFEPNRWYSMTAAGRVAKVNFGPDSNNFLDEINVTHVNISGNRDLILIALERAPSTNIATPRSPLLSQPREALANPASFWNQQFFTVAGWGILSNGSPSTFRRWNIANNANLDCNVGWPDAICTFNPTTGRSQTTGGDSGGPLYWKNPATGMEYVIGILQGPGPQGDRYHYLWSKHQLGWPAGEGSPPGKLINLTQDQWIRSNIDRSLCAVLKRQSYRNARLKPLYHWWSPSRGDNYSTAHDDWTGCSGDTLHGYTYVGELGKVYSNSHRRPSGTIPLYQWWSPGRGDNFISTDSRWSGSPGDVRSPDYRFVRVEGYIYPSYTSGSSLKRLWSWWSPSRGDNFATSDTRWSPAFGTRRYPDYRYYRLEGKLLP